MNRRINTFTNKETKRVCISQNKSESLSFYHQCFGLGQKSASVRSCRRNAAASTIYSAAEIGNSRDRLYVGNAIKVIFSSINLMIGAKGTNEKLL